MDLPRLRQESWVVQHQQIGNYQSNKLGSTDFSMNFGVVREWWILVHDKLPSNDGEHELSNYWISGYRILRETHMEVLWQM